MDTTTQPFGSAVQSIARERAIKAADDAGKPMPSEAELKAIADEAERRNTWGFDYKTDSKGNPIPQGIGAPGRETMNHFASIRRYEGQAAYERAVREIYRRSPDHARKIGLPEPTRAS
jgi:hypothetical protein